MSDYPAFHGKAADEASDGGRRSFYVEHLSHGHMPIPSAARIGRFLATSPVSGKILPNGGFPPTVEEEAANMFANLRRVLEGSGAAASDVLKVMIWVTTPEGRVAINEPWTAMFPDPQSRPARQILNHPDLPIGMRVQCEALAVLPG